MTNKILKLNQFSSYSALKPILTGFRIIGLYPPKKYIWLYSTYSIILNITITLYYPLSLLINLFYLDSLKSLFANLSILIESIVCGSKVFNAFIKRKDISWLIKLLSKLDARIVNDDEKQYFEFILKMANLFFLTLALTFTLCGTVEDVAVLFANERRLMYPAWFPWNWENSTIIYHATHAYQVVGIYYQIIMSICCDLYPGIFYWVLKGHLRALSKRIRKIGDDTDKSMDDNYLALVHSIKDHKICQRYFELCEKITARILLLQFICTQLVLCMTAVYMLLHNEDFLESIYLKIYLTCILLEVSLSCFCGSELTKESENLTQALYACNWMDQDVRFKKVLIIFMQQTQKPWTILAGGIISVSLETWLAILKSSYSLYVVCSQVL